MLAEAFSPHLWQHLHLSMHCDLLRLDARSALEQSRERVCLRAVAAISLYAQMCLPMIRRLNSCHGDTVFARSSGFARAGSARTHLLLPRADVAGRAPVHCATDVTSANHLSFGASLSAHSAARLRPCDAAPAFESSRQQTISPALPWPHGLSPCRASSAQSCTRCLAGRNGAAGLGDQIRAGSAAAAAAPASTPAMPRQQQQQQQPAQRPHSQLTTDLRKTTAQHSATVAACAAIAGCISRTATAPFDRVRIVSAGTGITLGHAIRRIRSEGASSLCAAHACISVCPHNGARHVCCSCFLLLPVHVCWLVPC